MEILNIVAATHSWVDSNWLFIVLGVACLFVFLTYLSVRNKHDRLMKELEIVSPYSELKLISEDLSLSEEERNDAHKKMVILSKEKTDPFIKELESEGISLERIQELIEMNIEEDEDQRVFTHALAALDSFLLKEVRSVGVRFNEGMTKPEDCFKELAIIFEKTPEGSRSQIECDLLMSLCH